MHAKRTVTKYTVNVCVRHHQTGFIVTPTLGTAEGVQFASEAGLGGTAKPFFQAAPSEVTGRPGSEGCVELGSVNMSLTYNIAILAPRMLVICDSILFG